MKLNILVVNDDGIEAEGIRKLVEIAKRIGQVFVVAPANQCSCMSQKITIGKEMRVDKYDFPVHGVVAYRVDASPTDCVKMALNYLPIAKPDIIFAGINYGYNTGNDIYYSGTVGAAREGVLNGIPAISFSNEAIDNYEVFDKYALELIQDIISREKGRDVLWNINFPGCSLEQYRGVMWDTQIASLQLYRDHFYIKEEKEDCIMVVEQGVFDDSNVVEGTDVYAVLNDYISISKIKK